MSDLCEFVFLDGPKNVTREEPIKYFVDKGVTPPFKRWAILNKPAYRSLPDGSTRINLSKTQVNLDDVLSTSLYVTEFMNRQERGFDGIAGFSQGMSTAVGIFKAQRYFSKDTWLRHPMPYFMIDFNAPVGELGTAE